MGDANSGSTITAKLNRIARRRQRDVAGVDALKALLDGAAADADVAMTSNLGVTAAATAREQDHIYKEVPDDIMRQSREFIDIVVQNDLAVSYSVSRGEAWEVKLALSVVEIEGEESDIEAQVSWVIPTAAP